MIELDFSNLSANCKCNVVVFIGTCYYRQLAKCGKGHAPKYNGNGVTLWATGLKIGGINRLNAFFLTLLKLNAFFCLFKLHVNIAVIIAFLIYIYIYICIR